MKLLLIMLLTTLSFNDVQADQYNYLWMLMEAPTASDEDVENNSYQINGAASEDDCMEFLVTYSDEKWRWCEHLEYDIKPLDRTKSTEEYYATQ